MNNHYIYNNDLANITKNPGSMITSETGTVSFSMGAAGTNHFAVSFSANMPNIPNITYSIISCKHANGDADPKSFTVTISNIGYTGFTLTVTSKITTSYANGKIEWRAEASLI